MKGLAYSGAIEVLDSLGVTPQIKQVAGTSSGALNGLLFSIGYRGKEITQLNLEKNIYDVIVLDTPPGSHFLDFLEGIDKIRDFFDQSFIDIFNYLDESKKSRLKTGRKLVTMMISSGVKKLLDYLGKVTGVGFVEDFMKAIGAIYSTQSTFVKALDLQQKLKRGPFDLNFSGAISYLS